MNFIAGIAVCMNSTPAPEECQRRTVLHWLTVPEADTGSSGCTKEGMLAAAKSGLLREDDHSKVFCRPEGDPGTEPDRQAAK
ncbi:MAG TPA: hypothetical protein VGO17_04325 [Aurantimonas sp.]|jgi:hypothetical protein|nr:hypothetical protein [Aurantimonas sp.]